MKKKQLRYKFLRTGLKSDSKGLEWEVGVWQKTKGKVVMCDNGFHCSKEALQALGYIKGEIVAIVEVRGESIIHDDKEVWKEMRIVTAYKWGQKDSVELALYAAEQVLSIFEKKYPDDKRPRNAIEAAKAWLKDPSEENKQKARIARDEAWNAWRAAAAYAAAYAAYAADADADAAAAAAYAAYAADAAAYASADAAAGKSYKEAKEEFYAKLHKWMRAHIKKLEKI